ncbi:Imm51 family immunity protein [Chryseolinea sp. T2]|uniref:Imm51 family immunity protein n=1 Tax=Chryseolinea sp. T2 TaxID=3129255 RepID=UPI00307730C8
MRKFTRVLILAALLVSTITCTKSTDKMTNESREEMARKEKEGFKQIAEASADAYSKMPYFPAQVSADAQFFSVQITATSSMFFTDEFDQHGLYGNGYCWAGIVEQLLEENNPALLKKVTLDPEADTCFISCPNEEVMNELAKALHESFSTKEKMLNVLKSADKSRLDC